MPQTTSSTLVAIPDRESLLEIVYRQMRTAILNGVFRPGQVVRQESAAEQLGISRGPLREALARLEAEGLVVFMPRRGYAVVSLDRAEISEIFELRGMLEAKLARLAAQHHDAGTSAELEALDKVMTALAERSDAAARLRWFELNEQLHTLLIRSAGCPLHARMLANVRALAEPYIRVETALTGDLAQAQREHSALVAAYAAGDGERLAALTRAHIEHTAERLLASLDANARTSVDLNEGPGLETAAALSMSSIVHSR